MLTNFAFFRAKPGQTKTLGKALTGLVDPTRQEAGCISYDLHQSLQDADSWFVYENWRSSADLDAHMQTAHIKAFLGLAPLAGGRRHRTPALHDDLIAFGEVRNLLFGKERHCHRSQW